MNVLVACEESQRVCIAFRKRGHRAFSCDLMECSGGHPEWHIQDDVLGIINGRGSSPWFTTCDGKNHETPERWDLIIAHPPCTYLTSSGARWFDVERYGDKAREREREREMAFDFFLSFVFADCDKIAIENPVGYINTHFRKPDQIYNPYDFAGETECKKTCLWLKGLPKLKPTQNLPVEKRTKNIWKAVFDGKQYRWNDPAVATLRSKTPVGVAEAMAEQWG